MTQHRWFRSISTALLAMFYLAGICLCSMSCTGAVGVCNDTSCTAADNPHEERGEKQASSQQGGERCGCPCICQALACMPMTGSPSIAIITNIYRIPASHCAPIAELAPPDHIPLL